MRFLPESQTTSIATHTNEDIFIRDRSLCRELIGELTFTDAVLPDSRPPRRPWSTPAW